MKFVGGPLDGRDNHYIPDEDNEARVYEGIFSEVDRLKLSAPVPIKVHLYRRTEVMLYVGEGVL